jgi:DUF4097 and DUF4098 domain-containing protein YvlB
MNPRKIALLLAILLFGAFSEVSFELRRNIDIGPAGCRVLTGRFKGRSFAFEAEETRAVPAATAFSIENAFGDVKVHAGAPGALRVKLRKVVYLATESEAGAFAANVRLTAVQDGATLRLGTNRAELDQQVGLETHFEIEIPAGSKLKVRSEHGEVSAADVGEADLETSYDQLHLERAAGSARLANRHGRIEAVEVRDALVLNGRYGDVELREIAGKVDLELDHGDVTVANVGALTAVMRYGELKAENVRGSLDVKGEHVPVRADNVSGSAIMTTTYAELRVKGVRGDARLKTEHGEVDAADVTGTASAETVYADVTLTGIGGFATVKVAHGGVTAKDLRNGARIEASGDEVSVDDFKGALEVDAQRASVRLAPATAVTQPIKARTTNGGIQLEVPEGSRFQLNASVRSGELDVSLPGLAVTDSSRDHVTGTLNGGGNPVTLTTDHGDVQISKRETVAKK